MLLNFGLPNAWLVVALPIIILLGWIIYTITLHPLSRVPGPFLARISRLWYLRKIWTEDVEKYERALHAKHGPLVRIAPNEVSCSEWVVTCLHPVPLSEREINPHAVPKPSQEFTVFPTRWTSRVSTSRTTRPDSVFMVTYSPARMTKNTGGDVESSAVSTRWRMLQSLKNMSTRVAISSWIG